MFVLSQHSKRTPKSRLSFLQEISILEDHYHFIFVGRDIPYLKLFIVKNEEARVQELGSVSVDQGQCTSPQDGAI